MLGWADKYVFAVDLQKHFSFSSWEPSLPAGAPGVATVPPHSFPPALAKKWGCVFAEPLFGVSTAGGEGPAAPGRERSTSLRRDRGQPECTEELLRAQQDQAGPTPQQGLSGRAFIQTWSSALGAAGPRIPPLPSEAGWWSGEGGKLGAGRRCHRRGGGGTGGYWETSPSHR